MAEYKSFRHRLGIKIDRFSRLTAEKINSWNKSCYNEYKDIDGTCKGYVGGDKTTGYLAHECITCKHYCGSDMSESVEQEGNLID